MDQDVDHIWQDAQRQTALEERIAESPTGKAIIDAIHALGTSINFFCDPASDAMGGWVSAERDAIFINTERPIEHQANLLIHESRHIINAFQLGLGRDPDAFATAQAFVADRLQDEALAFAASYKYMEEMNAELDFSTKTLCGELPGLSFEEAAERALAQLQKGRLGYRQRSENRWNEVHERSPAVHHDRGLDKDQSAQR